MSQRARFLVEVLSRLGSPYIWGAKGTLIKPGVRAYDCSGLVTASLLACGGPDWRADYNTDRLWDACKPTETLRPGTIVLYGVGGQRPDPSHVMVHVGEGVVVGASGGGSQTQTLEQAEAIGARVKVLRAYDYRPDTLGFRELPFADEGEAHG